MIIFAIAFYRLALEKSSAHRYIPKKRLKIPGSNMAYNQRRWPLAIFRANNWWKDFDQQAANAHIAAFRCYDWL